jgi:cytochrome-b5 reductase
MRCSTPLYQLVTHALADKSNKTKFKLIFSNVTEKDILLREEFDALKEKFPVTFDVVYTLDNPEGNWTGEFLLCYTRKTRSKS